MEFKLEELPTLLQPSDSIEEIDAQRLQLAIPLAKLRKSADGEAELLQLRLLIYYDTLLRRKLFELQAQQLTDVDPALVAKHLQLNRLLALLELQVMQQRISYFIDNAKDASINKLRLGIMGSGSLPLIMARHAFVLWHKLQEQKQFATSIAMEHKTLEASWGDAVQARNKMQGQLTVLQQQRTATALRAYNSNVQRLLQPLFEPLDTVSNFVAARSTVLETIESTLRKISLDVYGYNFEELATYLAHLPQASPQDLRNIQIFWEEAIAPLHKYEIQNPHLMGATDSALNAVEFQQHWGRNLHGGLAVSTDSIIDHMQQTMLRVQREAAINNKLLRQLQSWQRATISGFSTLDRATPFSITPQIFASMQETMQSTENLLLFGNQVNPEMVRQAQNLRGAVTRLASISNTMELPMAFKLKHGAILLGEVALWAWALHVIFSGMPDVAAEFNTWPADVQDAQEVYETQRLTYLKLQDRDRLSQNIIELIETIKRKLPPLPGLSCP